ncbi:homoserine dehydrogenase [Ktedonosporobacter rubrisoli]|uniref:Homoserine dehydrogenase n=1 Tax=Ktedonosporobacter rubrisoli TaxID=2509675 RepID=A0A4P6JHR2_KTERU|nr:homoserine dehydrogenase [Ktedonosporobacter rubrisoli]QBD74557.1 homoserine dehydrogenase [Ktedonosporobacter rubrisoli]
MHIYRLAIIGFGNVGQGFVSLLLEQRERLAKQYGLSVSIVAICDILKGSVYDPDGLDPELLLASIQATGTLEAVRAPHIGWSVLRTISESNAEVVVELSPTNLRTGEPALSHIRQALEQGRHVLTSNKGPAALYYPQLAALARARGVDFGIEGTVMSGTPTLRLGRELQISATITHIQGIFNGTTNFILTQMEQGLSFENALAQAQEQGYAEANPEADVEGYDIAAKLMILAHLFMDTTLRLDDIDRHGITQLTGEDIIKAKAAKESWKFLGTLEQTAQGVKGHVGPVRLPAHHSLASIQGATNAIVYSTDVLGDVTLIGPGAGRMETAAALLNDLVALQRKREESVAAP